MRGKRPRGFGCLPLRRITPADAGKTEQIPDKRLLRKDHPRGCGENSSIKSSLRFSLGSPPRMRGKPPARAKQNELGGITPADAGKTRQQNGGYAEPEDHPRVCGENCIRNSQYHQPLGSPPRMRGKLKQPLYPASACRITPAYAGKTSPSPNTAGRFTDHPRRCGENLRVKVLSLPILGSPPQVRGKLW